MKTKVITLFASLLMVMSLSLQAQNKKKNDKEKVTFDVSMTCDNCKKRIEKNISFEKGVSNLIVNLPDKTVFVEFQGNKTDTLKLKKAIEKLGYEVGYHANNN